MDEIRAVRGTNGYNVASFFSGCGGSCTGFEMAGFKIVSASEFVEEARNTYTLNHEHTPVDGRDIREVTARDIFDLAGTDQIDVVEGSPPCASFSTAGSRHKGWGQVKQYSDTQQRSDDLFLEFARIVADIQPKVFVAENVKGLVVGSAKGYFKMILSRLKRCGYRVEARLIDASLLGVPQARQRVIFIGVREDLNKPPVFPKPFAYRYSIADAIKSDPNMYDPETGEHISFEKYSIYEPWLNLRQGETAERPFQLVRPSWNKPVPTVTATHSSVGAASITHPDYPRKFNLKETRLLCGFPEDFQLTGTFQQRGERLGRAVPPLMMKAIAETVRDEILNGHS